MSEGFGDLSNLETLNLFHCEKLELLPASKSGHSESFYFLIFVLRRLRAVVLPHFAQPLWRRRQPNESPVASRKCVTFEIILFSNF